MFKSSRKHQEALSVVCETLIAAAFDSRDVDEAIEELVAATNVRVMMKLRRN